MRQVNMIEQRRSAKSSRRKFLMVASSLPFLRSAAVGASRQMLTAGQVIDRIKANIGIPWRAQTVDNLIGGTLLTPVRGIATTMMATLDVLQRANASGKSMVITHESTFFSHQDSIQAFANDSTYAFKLDFLNKNQMAVFHFHDHWHARKPDGIAIGMMQELGWQNRVDPQNVRRFSFDAVPLAAFARDIQARLNIRVVRVVGDPAMPVRKVVASWGNVSLSPGAPLLAQEDVDVLIIGETHEWELVEYAQDMIASGKKKALIILGHVVSEQAGMKYCAEWLRGFIPEVPIEFIAADEPYWSPAI
jgi:putative NIF3 family GTP cyclohydrolase 1 type 2